MAHRVCIFFDSEIEPLKKETTMNIGDRVELTGNTAIGETISDLYKGMRGTYYGDGSGTFYIALEGLPKGSGHDCGGNLPLGKFGFYLASLSLGR